LCSTGGSPARLSPPIRRSLSDAHHQHACSLNATMPEDRMVWCRATSCGSNISTPCHRRRGTWRESEDAASINRPPATKTEGRLNSDNSYEAPPNQPQQIRDAEPHGYGNKPGSDIEQRHRPRVAEEVQRLQWDNGEQDRLPHARGEKQAEERQCLAARQSADRSWDGRAPRLHGRQ
jgi:hypothetical protein